MTKTACRGTPFCYALPFGEGAAKRWERLPQKPLPSRLAPCHLPQRGRPVLRLRRTAACGHAALPKLRWFLRRGSAHALPFGEGAPVRTLGRERLPSKNLFRHGLRRATFPKGEGFLRLRRTAACGHAALPKLRWFLRRGSAHAFPFGEGAAKRRERLPQKPLPSRLAPCHLPQRGRLFAPSAQRAGNARHTGASRVPPPTVDYSCSLGRL